MFKDWEKFVNYPKQVCYIPEGSDREYTKEDLLKLCKEFIGERSNMISAEKLTQIVWDLLEWQHPETVLDELERDRDECIYTSNHTKDDGC